MQGLDKQTFIEVIIHPSGFLEQFADFISEYFTPDSENLAQTCAIEYLDTSSNNPFLITYDDETWHGTLGFDRAKAKACAQSEQLIMRLEKDYFINHAPTAFYPSSSFSESTPNLTSSEPTKSPFINALYEFATALSERIGENIGFCYHIEEKQNRDWIEAYKESIQPVTCGRFYIRASWHTPLAQLSAKDFNAFSESSPQAKAANTPPDSEIIIDPALAFGSGHHASTSMCLELLSGMELRGKSLLDVGCGSGILSIAASKLGAKVYACDTDLLAVEECAKNAATNHTSFQKIWHGSISDGDTHADSETPSTQPTPQAYDVIVANIIAFVVKLLHNDFKAKLEKDGVLILSGILSEYKSDIMKAFDDFEVLQSCQKEGWVALQLRLK